MCSWRICDVDVNSTWAERESVGSRGPKEVQKEIVPGVGGRAEDFV